MSSTQHQGLAGGMAGNKPATRPGVIPLSIKEKSALLAAYMPFLENGGLFVPTDKSAQIGDELYIILTLMDDATKTAIPGRVAWVTPAGATAVRASASSSARPMPAWWRGKRSRRCWGLH